FADAMLKHLDVTKRRVLGSYVRQRALFAEAVVAALVDGELVEFPAAAWDVEMWTTGRRRPIRIQVKCSGERCLRILTRCFRGPASRVGRGVQCRRHGQAARGRRPGRRDPLRRAAGAAPGTRGLAAGIRAGQARPPRPEDPGSTTSSPPATRSL